MGWYWIVGFLTSHEVYCLWVGYHFQVIIYTHEDEAIWSQWASLTGIQTPLPCYCVQSWQNAQTFPWTESVGLLQYKLCGGWRLSWNSLCLSWSHVCPTLKRPSMHQLDQIWLRAYRLLGHLTYNLTPGQTNFRASQLLSLIAQWGVSSSAVLQHVPAQERPKNFLWIFLYSFFFFI